MKPRDIDYKKDDLNSPAVIRKGKQQHGGTKHGGKRICAQKRVRASSSQGWEKRRLSERGKYSRKIMHHTPNLCKGLGVFFWIERQKDYEHDRKNLLNMGRRKN
ncbi:hypothetical protein DCMF_24460 [Candidatus Formimonas warabiya]|uniref:Uncharacterized protein n=1 Tax=Formimonas warabiya TaxID=1761012 RepID=A0A3G1KYB7_FORW1|nr:hypothetical protein DCMF_24460 [Candidatus Formimonas warabiya]